jgi:hypothetical protein
VLVLRNGVEIGRARIVVDTPDQPLGTHAFIALAAPGAPAAGTGMPPGVRWVAIGLPGHMDEANRPLDPRAAARVHMPPDFRTKLQPLVIPGVTMMVTDAAVLESTTGQHLTVMGAGLPAGS